MIHFYSRESRLWGGNGPEISIVDRSVTCPVEVVGEKKTTDAKRTRVIASLPG
jgi:hypothetical protein